MKIQKKDLKFTEYFDIIKLCNLKSGNSIFVGCENKAILAGEFAVPCTCNPQQQE